jgi:RNA polymerase sigma-70 factor (ECF subfamily)
MNPDAVQGERDDAALGSGLADLVRRIQAGDPSAESELVARFSHGLLLMLRQLARNPSLADDLHQETLALVLQKIRRGEVREPERLAAFIRSTARNLFIADRRKEARYHPIDADEEGREPDHVFVDRRPAPFEQVSADQEARHVQRMLSELRFDRDRQVLIRFYLADQPKESICEELEIEPERFNQVLFRARERLRELWEKEERKRRFFDGVRKFVGTNPSGSSRGI